jgi:uncharacterized protein YdeI (YjbR/CyaY-like superfamily)
VPRAPRAADGDDPREDDDMADRAIDGAGPDGRRSVEPSSIEQWAVWLAEHQDDGAGAWLVYRKKGAGTRALPYEDLVVEALRVGWIDSTAGRLDEERSLLWFAPRKKGSGWSRPNKERIARLEAEGRMLPRGAAVLAAARADGSWTVLDDAEAGVEPVELTALLDADPAARTGWDGFTPGARKVMLSWVALAKRAETREARIARIAAEAREGRKAYG